MRIPNATLVALACVVLAPAAPGPWAATGEGGPGEECLTCHRKLSPGLYRQWSASRHGEAGVTCIECHGAAADDTDAFEHHGALIATLVTPRDCGACHAEEAEQTSHSYHAKAGRILDSKDAYLAHVAAGEPVAITGCESCHGTKVEIDPDSPNRLSRRSWPNSGIGRINPDGSLGSCTACHTRHGFSRAQARQPESCSKCHLGPDHPQKEVYEESKHGNTYYTNIDEMNLDSGRWVVGEDYFVAPTCATCHMSATRRQGVSHDVGRRISWNLRAPISKRKENWPERRKAMAEVCSACHSRSFVAGFFEQFDATVRLYDEKFARPATKIMTLIRKSGKLENPAAFSNDIEWIYWELWHHEGRRARHGAAMMGPDYAWWHGLYEIAQHFYFKFLPAARAYGVEEVDRYIDDLLKNDPMHTWLQRNTDELKQEIRSGELQKAYRKLFEQEVEGK